MRAEERAAMTSLSPSTTSIYDLPECCMSHILSMTTPRDVCRASSVSSMFRSASDSDYVWEEMLPSDWKEMVSRSVSPVRFSSKKELFFLLASSVLIIDAGRRSFSLDRATGRKILMLSARELLMVWGKDPRYWRWTKDVHDESSIKLADLGGTSCPYDPSSPGAICREEEWVPVANGWRPTSGNSTRVLKTAEA